jgi:hypothetical protein
MGRDLRIWQVASFPLDTSRKADGSAARLGDRGGLANIAWAIAVADRQDMNIERYARAKQIALAQSMAGRAKVYLDVRFWIMARDSAAGTDNDPHVAEMLGLLRDGVAAGKLVCPVGASTFVEVMKQANTKTRRLATARLVDELSLGLSITEGRGRIGTEIAYFFYKHAGGHDLHPLTDLVWTKLSYALGYVYSQFDGVPEPTASMLQCGVFDEIWDASLTSIVTEIGDRWTRTDDLAEAAKRINTDIKSHAPQLVSYQATYRDEIVGCLDLCQDMAAEAIADMAARQGVAPPEPGSDAWTTAGLLCRNLLIAAFEKPDTGLDLRTIHAQACCHAGLRWDRGTNFTENHIYDFEHAAAAVAYCDAFLTEGFLAKLVNDGHVRLDQLNNCRTTASKQDAVTIVRDLLDRRGA